MMVTKQCPNCQQHVPVACKACPCGHVFFVARRAVSIQKTGRTDEGEVKRRRTERTKRERPDYFNSLQIDNELKKMKNQQKSRKKSDSAGANEKDGEGSNSEEGSEATNQAQSSLSTKHKKRGRPKKNFSQDKSDSKADKEEEVDMFANLSKEKEEQFSIILSEINRKMLQQQFRID
ncbi:UPF0547 protein C16orf87-like protein [Trichonephila clavata]|uniref:UPF0547 protein C16orf87-like protein n=1 Tax=Trichonephila clavata TaxID=2740835 RepID=A0A8X6KUP9_TRICU|nr:UPF0547 protein C16orf87-like protein [Trichonephila clavata]